MQISTSEPEALRVAIVGAGSAGTLVAVHLLRQELPVHVDLIDERIPGRGLAYSTVWDDHLLNVPAIRMSALGSDPAHFLRWLQLNGRATATPETFAPRKLFGAYLQDLLQTTARGASRRHRFRHHFAQGVRLVHDGDSARLTLDDGDRIVADRMVVATGNPAPRPLKVHTPGYFGSPWEAGALTGLDPDRDVLLAGAGLTAIDAFLALESQQHRGTIHCFSRRGKIPHVHTIYRTLPEPFVPLGITNARHLLRAIRRRVQEAGRLGYDWRAVVDSLRPITNELWSNLPSSEQTRVLQRLKTWWDIHRHRMAPEIGARVAQALKRQQLRVYAGRLAQLTPQPGGLAAAITRRSGEALSLEVQRVINCTGSDEDYRRSSNPLLQSLIESGRIRPHAIGKGLDSGRHGALLDAGGFPSDWLFTLGPPRLGGLFETTAVPEIRIQAEALANHLVSSTYEPVEVPVEYFMAAGI